MYCGSGFFFENNIEMEVCDFAEECTEWMECMISIFTGLLLNGTKGIFERKLQVRLSAEDYRRRRPYIH